MHQAGLERGCVGFGAGICVAEHGDRRIGEGHRFQLGGKGGGGCRHKGGVEGTADGQGNRPFALQVAADGCHRLGASGEHHLGVAVVVGNYHSFGGCHQVIQLAALEAHHRRHGAAAGSSHQGAAAFHQLQTGGEVEYPRHMQGDQFAQAVARY